MNSNRGKIKLEAMEFYAHHGYFKEEKTLGNRFIVDVELEVDFLEAAISDDLDKTADYTKVYTIVSSCMMTKVNLLEHLAYKINSKILEQITTVKAVSVCISKQNPPIGGVCGSAKVNLATER